jgi:inorganic pyrophosphatase
MASIFERLSARGEDGLVNVVIDTPKGSRNKYKYDEEAGVFRLGRILPAGMAFPHDFGSIPRTLAEDGDPLDVMVLTHSPSFAGCVLHVRLIGTIRGKQTEKRRTIRNDRLLAVPVTPVNDAEFRDVADVPRAWVDEIQHFFRAYNEAQGRRFETIGVGGPARAESTLRAAELRYAKAMK